MFKVGLIEGVVWKDICFFKYRDRSGVISEVSSLALQRLDSPQKINHFLLVVARRNLNRTGGKNVSPALRLIHCFPAIPSAFSVSFGTRRHVSWRTVEKTFFASTPLDAFFSQIHRSAQSCDKQCPTSQDTRSFFPSLCCRIEVFSCALLSRT